MAATRLLPVWCMSVSVGFCCELPRPGWLLSVLMVMLPTVWRMSLQMRHFSGYARLHTFHEPI